VGARLQVPLEDYLVRGGYRVLYPFWSGNECVGIPRVHDRLGPLECRAVDDSLVRPCKGKGVVTTTVVVGVYQDRNERVEEAVDHSYLGKEVPATDDRRAH
jgi:hypothetical protein